MYHITVLVDVGWNTQHIRLLASMSANFSILYRQVVDISSIKSSNSRVSVVPAVIIVAAKAPAIIVVKIVNR